MLEIKMAKSSNDALADEITSYVRWRLSMALVPVRRTLLNMDAPELAELVRQQSEDIGNRVHEIVERHHPEQ